MDSWKQVNFFLLGFLLSLWYKPQSLFSLSTSSSLKLSKIDCNKAEGNCVLINAYKKDDHFHLFLSSPSTITSLESTIIFSGIGSGSPGFYFDSWTFNNDTAQSNRKVQLENWSVSKNVILFPIFIHFDKPDPSFQLLEVKYFPLLLLSTMWNNFFRTIYALYGGWCGMLSHNLLYPEKYKIALVEKRHHAPKDYLYILKKAAPSGVLYYQDIEDGIYKAVFVGIPRSCLFGEIHHENESYRDLARNVAMNQLRSWFLAKFKVSQVEKPSWITFIVRNEPIRNILNVDQVADVLASFGEVKVVDFANLSLYQQLQIILKTKILITLHGAALTHSFFLPKDSCVIEIFPFQFRKYIYQNICRIIGIKYMPFENKKIENTVFNWDYVERHRFTSRSKEEIVSKPVDWFNMDSKNYYRNQDTLVDLNELKNIMNMAQQTIPYKFMLYLPWEQLNNQVIGFKVGCAIANFTSRVLVLPRIGYRKEFNEERKIFEVMDFEWREFDKYFVVEEGCPCKTVSFEVFQALNRGKEIENVYFRGIGNSVNFSYMQIIDYYKHVIGLGFKNIKRLPLGDKDVHLTRQEIIQKFKEIPNDRVLALGSLFWLYGFEQNPEYPLTRYYDYLEDPLYKQISETLAFQSNYEEMFKKAQLEVLGQTYGAIHIRRGDYRDKCKEVLHNSTLYMSCYQSLDAILQVIERKDPSIKWYIATNDFNEREIRAFLDRKGIETVNFHDIKEHLPLSLDPIEVSIIDQLICINSIHFHGNFYSSFSRTIAEKRALVNKKSFFF